MAKLVLKFGTFPLNWFFRYLFSDFDFFLCSRVQVHRLVLKNLAKFVMCFFARRPQEHLWRIPLFPWTAALIRGIQIWRWPQPKVTLDKNYCKMDIVTKFSCFIYWFLYLLLFILFIYSFYVPVIWKNFLCFFRARRAPRLGFSSCWAILKIYINHVFRHDFVKSITIGLKANFETWMAIFKLFFFFLKESSRQRPRSAMSRKTPGEVRARTCGTKSPSRSEALRFIDSSKSPST